MIFVTVGTNEAPFDRLLEAVGALSVRDEDLLVQLGPSQVRPLGARSVDFLPFNRLVEEVRRARIVVAHAGVGSVIVALANGKRPIVMPRLQRHGEAVDDHQATFAQRFESEGLVTVVQTAEQLRRAVHEAVTHNGTAIVEGGELAEDLRRYLAACVGNPLPAR